MLTIGFAGTAKNTGKTSSLNAFHRFLHQNGRCCLITSIGLDGEAYDQLTSLPKPRIDVFPGDWVITAAECYRQTQVSCQVIESYPIQTPLGALSLFRINSRGSMMVAGPSSSTKLQTILESCRHYPIEFVLVDGALNRLFPLRHCQKLILSTGAARHIQPDILSEEIRNFVQWISLFSLHPSPDTYNVPGLYRDHQLCYPLNPDSACLEDETIRTLLQITLSQPGDYTLSWNRLILWENLSLLLKMIPGHSRFQILLDHPFFVLGEINSRWITRILLTQSHPFFWTRSVTKISLITVNPFFPKQIHSAYFKSSINQAALIRAFDWKVTLPVIDLFQLTPEEQNTFFIPLIHEEKNC